MDVTSNRPAVQLGTRLGPFAGCLDADLLRRYSAATNDPSPRAASGTVVPSTAVVTQIWEAQNAGMTRLVPQEVWDAATGGVHGEHDIVLHRPIVPGEPLTSWVEGHGTRPGGRNSLISLHYTTVGADGDLIAEQWWTTVLLGTACDTVGEPVPDHRFPDEARPRPVGTWAADVDDGMARRYAEMSDDWSAHHFDLEAARRSGFDRLFLHGLCTMALCAHGVAHLVADGDHERVRRIAVRFAAPTFLGERLHVHVYDAGALGYAFEADCAGATVVSHGRVELR